MRYRQAVENKPLAKAAHGFNCTFIINDMLYSETCVVSLLQGISDVQGARRVYIECVYVSLQLLNLFLLNLIIVVGVLWHQLDGDPSSESWKCNYGTEHCPDLQASSECPLML